MPNFFFHHQRELQLVTPVVPPGRNGFDKAFTNTLKSRTLANLRDTLLPKLLNGELKTIN